MAARKKAVCGKVIGKVPPKHKVLKTRDGLVLDVATKHMKRSKSWRKCLEGRKRWAKFSKVKVALWDPKNIATKGGHRKRPKRTSAGTTATTKKAASRKMPRRNKDGTFVKMTTRRPASKAATAKKAAGKKGAQKKGAQRKARISKFEREVRVASAAANASMQSKKGAAKKGAAKKGARKAAGRRLRGPANFGPFASASKYGSAIRAEESRFRGMQKRAASALSRAFAKIGKAIEKREKQVSDSGSRAARRAKLIASGVLARFRAKIAERRADKAEAADIYGRNADKLDEPIDRSDMYGDSSPKKTPKKRTRRARRANDVY